MPPTLTERLARFIAQADRATMPLGTAQYYVLDWLGSALAGTQTLPGRILLDYAASQPRVDGGCAIAGLPGAFGAESAALANGGLSHIVEMDDLDRASITHPGTVVIPAALAVAQRERASGAQFLRAVIIGYEVLTRVGAAVGKSHYYYFHNTATCGTFGAAAAAAYLPGLNEQQTVWALGNAGTMSAGLWEFNADGAMSKHLHAGRAAQSGVLAADLARRGFSGPRAILEGERGFFAATSRDATPDRVIAGLDPEAPDWRIGGVSIKPHASCRHTHPAVDAALAIRAQMADRIAPADVSRIEIETYQAALDLCDNAAPVTPYQAKFSLHYCVASALVRGHAGLADFLPERIAAPALAPLMAATRLRHSPEFESRYPRQWPSNVTVAFANGRVISQTIDSPKGDPENALSQAELEAKFTQMLDGTPFDPVPWMAFVSELPEAEAVQLPA